MPRPASDPDIAHPHLRLRFVVLVAAGGALGTAARYGVGVALPHRTGQWPWSTLVVNIVGAFVLGLVLELLLRHGPDTGARRIARLGIGTGFCGAFTTYSALATDTVLQLDQGSTATGLLYAVGSVGLGLLATVAGLELAARGHPGDHRDDPVDPDLPGADG